MKYFVGILCCLLLIIVWLLTTTTGLRSVIYVSSHFLPGKLDIAQVNGFLLSDVELKKVTYKSDGLTASIEEVLINWDLKKLITQRKLYLENVLLNNVNVTLFPAPKSASAKNESSSLPQKIEKLKYLALKNLTINSVQITNNGALSKISAIFFNQTTLDHYRFSILSGSYQSMPLTGAAIFAITKDAIEISKLNFSLGKIFLDVQGYYQTSAANIHFQLNAPNLKSLANQLNGRLNINGTFTKINAVPNLNATMSASNIKVSDVSINAINGKIASNLNSQLLQANMQIQHVAVAKYLFKRLQFTSLTNLKNYQTRFNLQISPNNKIYGEVNSAQSSKLDAQIRIALQKFNELVTIKTVKNLHGVISGRLHLVGSVSEPLVRGQIDLTDAGATIPDSGVKVNAPHFQAMVDYPNAVNLYGTFNTGTGSGTIRAGINPEKIYPIVVKVNGSNLQALNTTDYKVMFSPDLTATIDQNAKSVKGEIRIPYLNITADKYRPVVTLPSELTVTTDRHAKFTAPSDIAMNIKIVLGDRIFVAYKGLHATLGGAIDLTKIIGGLPTANGTLNVVKGEYRIYNVFVTIQDGRLIYLGNLIANPGLDLKALKDINSTANQANADLSQKTYVGARIQGTLDEPQITFISNPPMSQNDILSYLVFGVPASQMATGAGLSLLGSVAGSLNMQNPNASDSSNKTTFFSMPGLFSGTSTLNIQHPFTKHWRVQTQAGINDTSIDILYAYEHD